MQSIDPLTIGIDISDKHSHICVLGPDGGVVERTRIASSPVAFERYFGGRESLQIALEVGTHSPWMSRLLEQLGHEVLVANARSVELISKNNSKSDRNDAELLARVARVDPELLSPIQHRSEEAQADLAVIRSRKALVDVRAELVNHVRGAAKAMGTRLPKKSTSAFADEARKVLPPALRPALAPLLTQIKALTKQIKSYDKRLAKIADKRYPVVEHLQQVAGVGLITALCYVLTLEDPRRFKSSRAVGSYLGLRPRQDDSGENEPELRITKAGSPALRAYLVQAAHYILGAFGPDTDLRRWGKKLEARGGKRAKKVAVVAVARKLAVLLHRLWLTGEVYEPLRNSRKHELAA